MLLQCHGDNTQVGNAIINFSQNQIVEGDALSHTQGSSEIMINEDGIYQISYSLTGVGQDIGRFNFSAILPKILPPCFLAIFNITFKIFANKIMKKLRTLASSFLLLFFCIMIII